MSISNTKPAKQAVNNGKIRYNININGITRQRGGKLAGLERRSFSNFLEILIDREFGRVFPKG